MIEKRSTEAEWDRPPPGHVLFCEKSPEGPVFRLNGRVDEMETRLGTIETERTAEKGAAAAAQRQTLRAVQLLTAISALSTIIGFILSHWPHK